MNAHDQRVIDNVAKYGCHVFHVLGEVDLPPFSYSVGIQKMCGDPEVIVVGLQQSLAHRVVNAHSARVRAGEWFRPDLSYPGFFDDFEVRFIPVGREHYATYLGRARQFYEGDGFDMLQMVYPLTSGVWPWEPAASEEFRLRQPLLGTVPPVSGIR